MRQFGELPRYKFGFSYICISLRLYFYGNPYIDITYIARSYKKKLTYASKFVYNL